jgi:protein-S-isoprenylcysteine O-methyltransferase Ste14
LALHGRDDGLVRAGAWLFRQRTWIPLPLALTLFFLRPEHAQQSGLSLAVGVAIVVGAELLRLWAVHHIGVVSRTRSDRLGPLVRTGPFAFVRNPLYIANIALWAGFALIAQLAWLIPIFVVVVGLEYHAIVRWEERLLDSRCGDEYRAYVRQVPRWIPTLRLPSGPSDDRRTDSWRDTFFSERGTLIAIAVGGLALWLKAML